MQLLAKWHKVHVNCASTKQAQLSCYSLVHHMQELPNAYLKRCFCLLYLCGTHNSKQFDLKVSVDFMVVEHWLNFLVLEIDVLWISFPSWSEFVGLGFYDFWILSLGVNLLVLSSYEFLCLEENFLLCLWISFHLEWILVLGKLWTYQCLNMASLFIVCIHSGL